MIRSQGGWAEVKVQRGKGQETIESDERILRESDFVEAILAQANERYTRRYAWKRRGVGFAQIEQKVAEIYHMDPRDVVAQGRQRGKVTVRGLLCYSAVRELSHPLPVLARQLGVSLPSEEFAFRGRATIRLWAALGVRRNPAPPLWSATPGQRGCVPGSRRVSGGPALAVKRKRGVSQGGPRSPRWCQARRPTSPAVWRAGYAATTRCRESGNRRRAAGELWAGASHNPRRRRIFSMTAGCSIGRCGPKNRTASSATWIKRSTSTPSDGNTRASFASSRS